VGRRTYRGVADILAADAAGYSQLMEDDEVSTTSRI
jgi:hypothetical protein